eukprot:47084_1
MFSIKCAPNGYDNSDIGEVRLFLQICALPPNIKSINFVRHYECKEAEKIKIYNQYGKNSKPWGYTKGVMRQCVGWKARNLSRCDISQEQSVTFIMHIKILSYTTIDGQVFQIPGSINYEAITFDDGDDDDYDDDFLNAIAIANGQICEKTINSEILKASRIGNVIKFNASEAESKTNDINDIIAHFWYHEESSGGLQLPSHCVVLTDNSDFDLSTEMKNDSDRCTVPMDNKLYCSFCNDQILNVHHLDIFAAELPFINQIPCKKCMNKPMTFQCNIAACGDIFQSKPELHVHFDEKKKNT